MSQEKVNEFIGSGPWGAARRMSKLDALMWRGQSDRMLRPQATVVFVLNKTPSWETFLAEHDRYVSLVPRFRHRVVDTVFGMGLPRWENDPDFDLRYHLGRVRLPRAAGLTGLLEYAEQSGRRPLDLSRPLWEATLVENLDEEGERAGYLLKMHHSMIDGISWVRLVSLLFEPDAEARQRAGEEAASAAAMLERRDSRRGLTALGRAMAEVGRLPGVAVQALRHPGVMAREAWTLAASLRSMVVRSSAAPSPLLRARGGPARFLALDVSLAELREAVHRSGSTINDGFVAAVSGALRRYHDAYAMEPGELPVAVALGELGGQNGASGNNLSFTSIAAPVAERDVVRQLRRAGAQIDRARLDQVRTRPAELVTYAGLLPGSVFAPLARRVTRLVDLQLSNVRGPAQPLVLAGSRIEQILVFGPVAATAGCLVLLSYQETCFLGLNLDSAAIRDPELFARCLSEAFADVLHNGLATPADARD